MSKFPLPVLYILADLLYLLLYHGIGYQKSLVLKNLRLAFPEKSLAEIHVIARDSYRNILTVLVEVIKAISISQSELQARVQINNLDVLEDYLNQGQSVILLSGHLFNWEWLFLASCIQCAFPMDAIYKPLSREPLNKLLLEVRSRFGGYLIHKDQTLVEIMRRRHLVRAIALVADQGPKENEEKYWTTLLGQPTAFFTGFEKLVRLTRYPVLFVAMKRTRRGYYWIDFKKILEPRTQETDLYSTERPMECYVRELQNQILTDPSSWLWIYKRWKYKKPLYT